VPRITATGYGHWITFPFEPDNYVGFVYRITNITTHEFYIGKKLLHRTKKLPPLKGKKNKRLSKVPSDWETYTSSSKTLNQMIDDLGDHLFRFEILELHTSKFDLGVAEFCCIAQYIKDPGNLNQFIGFKGSIKK
jgi:hypothetical protein